MSDSFVARQLPQCTFEPRRHCLTSLWMRSFQRYFSFFSSRDTPSVWIHSWIQSSLISKIVSNDWVRVNGHPTPVAHHFGSADGSRNKLERSGDGSSRIAKCAYNTLSTEIFTKNITVFFEGFFVWRKIYRQFILVCPSIVVPSSRLSLLTVKYRLQGWCST